MAELVDYLVKGSDGKDHLVKGPKDSKPEDLSAYVESIIGQAKESQPQDFLGSPEDLAKSAGIGLAQGGIGLVTMPGNIERLGRVGIDAAARKLGMKDPELSKNQALPTYDDLKGIIEEKTGKFYEPQSRMGKYARTLGEFAPGGGVVGGFSRGSRMVNALSNTVIPGLVSETAGQLTEGTKYEPAARVTGALFGGILPKAAMRVATPITNEPVRQAQINVLRQNGVNSITAGQSTGNPAIRWMESSARNTPGGGSRARRIVDRQQEEFTRASARSAGMDTDRITLSHLDDAFENLGNQFDSLSSNNAIRADNQLVDDLGNAWRDYSRIKGQHNRAPVVENTIRDVYAALQNPNNRGLFSGQAYSTLRHDLGKIERSQAFNDPALSEAVRSIRIAMDNAMERSISPQAAEQWRTIRDQYQNLLAVEKARMAAGENTALGLVSPANMRSAVRNQNKRQSSRGQRDLYNLAEAGEAIIKPLQSSGTAERMAARDFLNPAAVTRAISARTIMSRPVQNWLSNQAFANAIPAYERIQPTSFAGISIAGIPNALEQTQRLPFSGGYGSNWATQEEDQNLRKLIPQ